MLNKKRKEIILPLMVIFLSLIGVIFIYSASRYSALSTYGDSFYYVKKQVIGIFLGIIVLFFLYYFDYNKLKKFVIPLSIISFILLILVFIPGLGVESYGAKRWINLGFFTIQPSEIAKFSLILFASTYIDKKPKITNSFLGILPIIIYGAIICLLIILEPNMSITICVCLLLLTLLFQSGTKLKYIIFMLVTVGILGVFLIIIEPYRLNRLMAFINPWENPKGEGYQLLQSLYALGSGGWFGVGIFNSRQKYAFLPFAESDFILSIIGEEVGLIGLIFFFFLIFLIFCKGVNIASKSKNIFGMIMAIGISMIFAIQVVVNALVVTGSIPPTGLPLPFISSGNTSIIVFMAEIGILCNISNQNKNNNQ